MLSLSTRLPVRIDLKPAGGELISQTIATESEHSLAEKHVNGLTRSQIVDRILTMNPSATSDFLDRFDTPSLGAYLDHLTAASQPRGRLARWVRPAGGCGISWSVRRN